MNDQPPPTDRKPRRRASARKRPEATSDVMPAKAVADAQASPATPAAKKARPPRRARGGERGRTVSAVDAPESGASSGADTQTDTSASDVPASTRAAAALGNDAAAPTLNATTADATPSAAVRASNEARGATGDASGGPARQHSNTTPPAAPTATDPAAAPSPVARDVTDTRAAPIAPAEHADSPSAAPMRQALLRPGELIRVPLSVRWRDLDAFNHVNNSKYLSYLEEARLRWMLSVPGMGMDENVAPVVAASNLSYRRPIGWPGDVVVELFVERVGGSSLTVGHRIVDATDGSILYCDGNVVMVWIDRRTGRSAPLPAGVRSACS